VLILAPYAAPNGFAATSCRNVEEITVCENPQGDDGLPEFIGEAIYDIPAPAFWAVIRNYSNYPEVMPFVEEAQVIRNICRTGNQKNTVYVYLRVNPPFVMKRHFVIRIENDANSCVNGCRSAWRLANEQLPMQYLQMEGGRIVRVSKNEGAWILEPMNQGGRTRVIYRLSFDPGQGNFIESVADVIFSRSKLLRWANDDAMPQLFRKLHSAAQKLVSADQQVLADC
jgi:hypothetical protein